MDPQTKYPPDDTVVREWGYFVTPELLWIDLISVMRKELGPASKYYNLGEVERSIEQLQLWENAKEIDGYMFAKAPRKFNQLYCPRNEFNPLGTYLDDKWEDVYSYELTNFTGGLIIKRVDDEQITDQEVIQLNEQTPTEKHLRRKYLYAQLKIYTLIGVPLLICITGVVFIFTRYPASVVIAIILLCSFCLFQWITEQWRYYF